jgi:hypothetical protein
MAKPVLALAAFLVFGGCGGDGVSTTGDLVGGSCEDDRDCEEDCVRTGDFPGGMCTVVCSEDRHCPGGTYCIDRESGICALGCEVPGDCRPGYTCRGEDNRGHSGESLVCIDD